MYLMEFLLTWRKTIMGHSHCVFAYVYGFCWDTVKKNKNSDGYRDGAMAHTEENRPDVVLFGLHLLYFPNVYAFCAGHKSVGYYFFIFFIVYGIPVDTMNVGKTAVWTQPHTYQSVSYFWTTIHISQQRISMKSSFGTCGQFSCPALFSDCPHLQQKQVC